MATDDPTIKRIAEVQNVDPANAEAYVKSLGRQLGAADGAKLADAVLALLQEGRPFKAKDVARRLKGDPAPPGQTPEPPPSPQSNDTGGSTIRRAQKPGAEVRRDTRLRFEQWAKNPLCLANTVSAVHGISMAEVAKHEKLPTTMGQSPFALARGQNFERGLFRAGAERLITELAAKGVIPSADAVFRDFRLRLNGGPAKTLDDARAETARLFEAVASGPSTKKAILAAGATVAVPGGVMLPEAILVIDALVIRRDLTPPELIVGEIKTYPDRGGYTEPAQLAQARAQAGVYVHGLDLVCKELKIDGRVRVARKGFLVLSRPGFNVPSVRAGEDLAYQSQRAERGFERLRAVAAAGIPKAEPDRIAAVSAAVTEYREACLTFCDRVTLCREKALEAGDPTILGEEMRRFLGDVDLIRAVAILGGEKPKTDGERAFSQHFREAEELRAQ